MPQTNTEVGTFEAINKKIHIIVIMWIIGKNKRLILRINYSMIENNSQWFWQILQNFVIMHKKQQHKLTD